ncbi:RIO1 family regulatory kinase/ATPase domain-containing protein [Pseudomonas sp. X10]
MKDYRRYHGTLLALPARILVRNEIAILRRLAGWRHAPSLIGISTLAFSMEFIPGETLSQSVGHVGHEVLDQLQAALCKLHSENITHNDLHGTNVIVRAGVPVLIDFASAWHSPAWLRNCYLCRQLRRSDLKNFLKLRQRVTGLTSPIEVNLLADPRWIQILRNGWKRVFLGRKRC